MGCWNGTCAVSNLHISAYQDVAVLMLAENKNKDSFTEVTALYDVCPIIFYGKYNDYGGVEEEHGFGLNLVVDAIKDQLYEYGQGPNSSHDIEVTRSKFDFELMMEADRENRLAIENRKTWSEDEHDKSSLEDLINDGGLTKSQKFELDRLVNKIKAKDLHRQVTHVIIHKDIFNNILEKFYHEKYKGEGKGNMGYGNSYIHIYFKDVIDAIPEYIENKKSLFQKFKAEEEEDEGTVSPHMMYRIIDSIKKADRHSSNLVVNYLNYIDRSGFCIININEHITEYIREEQWDELAQFVKEALTGLWIHRYMDETRKVWTKQCGLGSQNNNPLGYQILADSINEILTKEKADYE